MQLMLRERGRQTDKHKQRQRQTDRQIDRQTDRQTDRPLPAHVLGGHVEGIASKEAQVSGAQPGPVTEDVH